jgi:hypothetical protein
VRVIEQILRRPKQQIRPFMESAEITSRCCSLPLQRAITDFGADNAFGQVPHKLKEHYGIEVSVSTARGITEHHGQQMLEEEEEAADAENEDLKTKGSKQIIAEIDGCMVPVVEENAEVVDKRKGKTTCWKETRLSLAHEQGSVSPIFRANFGGSTDDAGQSLRNCVIVASLGKQSQVHVVGDGAPWIAEQVEDKFGSQASYLIDFYHVCQYLAEAAKVCAPHQPQEWIETQKQLLKNNEYQTVLSTLNSHLQSGKVAEDGEMEEGKDAVGKCYQYLSNRINYLDYKGAMEQDLPIGSGEIESAHRYVIQKRLKLPGAWWTVENIKRMLALRVLRANGNWTHYWGQLSEAA